VNGRASRRFDHWLFLAEYRDLAEGAGDSAVKEDLFDWAAICDEVANNIDDRRASG
jgi:hypothetical protein